MVPKNAWHITGWPNSTSKFYSPPAFFLKMVKNGIWDTVYGWGVEKVKSEKLKVKSLILALVREK